MTAYLVAGIWLTLLFPLWEISSLTAPLNVQKPRGDSRENRVNSRRDEPSQSQALRQLGVFSCRIWAQICVLLLMWNSPLCKGVWFGRLYGNNTRLHLRRSSCGFSTWGRPERHTVRPPPLKWLPADCSDLVGLLHQFVQVCATLFQRKEEELFRPALLFSHSHEVQVYILLISHKNNIFWWTEYSLVSVWNPADTRRANKHSRAHDRWSFWK